MLAWYVEMSHLFANFPECRQFRCIKYAHTWGKDGQKVERCMVVKFKSQMRQLILLCAHIVALGMHTFVEVCAKEKPQELAMVSKVVYYKDSTRDSSEAVPLEVHIFDENVKNSSFYRQFHFPQTHHP